MGEMGLDVEGLLTEVGRTLLLWGFLETEMIAANFDWKRPSGSVERSDPAYPILRDIVEPRSVRNTIAHGMKEIVANPYSDDEPYVICRTLGGADQEITLGELQRVQRQLLKLRREFPLRV